MVVFIVNGNNVKDKLYRVETFAIEGKKDKKFLSGLYMNDDCMRAIHPQQKWILSSERKMLRKLNTK